MGVYARLVEIQPETLEVGKTATVKVDIYNNEGARYVTVEIKDTNTNRTIWRWQEYTQLGVTTVTKKLTVPPDIPDDPCLVAFADGNTLPEKTFEIVEIYVNDQLVWKNGKQIKEALMELEHYEDERLSKNKVKVKYFAIPLYSDKMKVDFHLERVDCRFSTDWVTTFATEGYNTVELELWGLGDARALIRAVKGIRDWKVYTKVLWNWTGRQHWIQCNVGRRPIFRTTVPEDGRYCVLFKQVHDNTGGGLDIFVEVEVAGRVVGGFRTKDEGEDVMVCFSAKAGDVITIYATPKCVGGICPWLILEDLMLVQENPVYCTIEVYANPSDAPSVKIPIRVRGYYDGWFGGPAAGCEDAEKRAIQIACSITYSPLSITRAINEISKIAEVCMTPTINQLLRDLSDLLLGKLSYYSFMRKWCR